MKQRSWLFWARIVIIACFAVLLVMQFYTLWQLRQEESHLQQQITELQKRNAELETEKQRLQDPKEIEALAREKLGLVKPGEVPYVK